MPAIRIAVAWPKPRAGRWQLGRAQPHDFPDLSDALLFLEAEGFAVCIEDSCPVFLNPLANLNEFYSGLDPARAARIAARARRYDAVVCVGDSTAFVLASIRRLFELHFPIVLIDPALADGYPRRKRLLDHLLPEVDLVLVYGTEQVDYLRGEYGSAVRALFVHHRADLDFYRPSTGRSPSASCVVSVGNDVSRDFDLLARAAAICRSDYQITSRFAVHTSREVANEGGALDVRRERISYSNLRALYAQASVVVVPLFDTRHAGGINALLEAMAMGRPTVVSGSRGIRDYVEDGVNSLVVPPRNAQVMAEAIASLIRSPELGVRLGENARTFVEDYCDNRKYAARLALVIREVIEARLARGAPERARVT